MLPPPGPRPPLARGLRRRGPPRAPQAGRACGRATQQGRSEATACAARL